MEAKIKTPTNTAAMTEKAAAPVQKKQKPVGAIDYLGSSSFKEQLKMALPKFFDTDRFVRSAISDFRLNPALQECSVPSVLGFYMQAAMCGLEPSSVLGQCYPVPFNNRKTGAKECQFIIGYRGMASIARRSGEVLSIDAKIVHEKDTFELIYGLDSNITHIPYLEGDPGAMIGAYCIVKFKDGSHQFEYMPKYKIDEHRKRSKAGNYGPWVTDYEEMAKKGLSIDTPIPTPDGWKQMGDIQVGDLVYDMHGCPTKVVAISEVKHLPCFKVTYSNGDSVICDNEHRWLAEFGKNAARNVRERGWNVHMIQEMFEAKEEGRSVVVPIAEPLRAENADLPIHPWLLGYWLGDGHSSAAAISCNQEWAEEVVKVIHLLTPYKVDNITNDKRSNSCQINVKDGFKAALRDANLLGNKHVPAAYLRASIPQRLMLLQGLMDSDGTIEVERGRAIFSNTNKLLADAVFELATSLGEVCHMHSQVCNGFGTEAECWFVEWFPSKFVPVTLAHHVEKMQSRKIAQYLSIKSIEPIESVPTKCIAVESDTHTYLCGRGFYVTHNTVFRSIFKWLPVSIEAVEAERADSNVVNYSPTAAASENPDDLIEIDFVAAAPEEGAAE